MVHTQIGSNFNWFICDRHAMRMTASQKDPVHDHNKCPNAYSAILALIKADHKGYAMTSDTKILDMSAQYRFIQKPRRERGDFRVEVHRTADDLAEIYQWFNDFNVNLSDVIVPWVHPAHTEGTWGYCPYCEEELTHQNWRLHYKADCLGNGSMDQEFIPVPSDFDKIPSGVRIKSEPLNLPRGILRLFRWKKLMRTVSGTYVCWEPSYSENTGFPKIPLLHVYGSASNGFNTHNAEKKRDYIWVTEPIAPGTMITVSPLRQMDESLMYWGKI